MTCEYCDSHSSVKDRTRLCCAARVLFEFEPKNREPWARRMCEQFGHDYAELQAEFKRQLREKRAKPEGIADR